MKSTWIAFVFIILQIHLLFALPSLNFVDNEINSNSIDNEILKPDSNQPTVFNRNALRRWAQGFQARRSASTVKPARQEDPDVEEVTPTVDSDSPSPTPPPRTGGFWEFFKAFLSGLRTGDHQSMLGQLVQQLTSFVQGMTNFFTGSNDVSFGMVEREGSSSHNRGVRRRPTTPIPDAELQTSKRSTRAKRLAPDDLLNLFATNSSQVEKQLKQGVRDIESSLDNLWSQLQTTFSRENVTQVLRKFELSEEQLEETKEIAKELHERVGMAWKQLSREVASRVDLLTEQVHALHEGLTAAANTTESKTEPIAN